MARVRRTSIEYAPATRHPRGERPRRFQRGLLLAAVCVLLHSAATAADGRVKQGKAKQASASAGTVNFFKRTSSNEGTYLDDAGHKQKSFVKKHFWHMLAYAPTFDANAQWYPRAWVYKDLYAIYKGSTFAKEHQSWILRNASGQLMYIPWGCSDGSCPQYAGDVGNAAFRHAWIAEAETELAKGYEGLWIDDVDLVFAVGNGSGQREAPIDPRTGKTMTETAWQEYVTTFVEEIRQALPEAQIVHNSVWYAGGPERWNNPLVKREIAAADYINLERGVNDPNMTGGTGEWSLSTFLSFVDAVHSEGRGAIFDSNENAAQAREYNLACYFLVSTGNDGVGDAGITPSSWWPGFEVSLGAARGARGSWDGLTRREFSDGLVLVNEPQAPARTVTLPSKMVTISGEVVHKVTLPAASGLVLRYQPGS